MFILLFLIAIFHWFNGGNFCCVALACTWNEPSVRNGGQTSENSNYRLKHWYLAHLLSFAFLSFQTHFVGLRYSWTLFNSSPWWPSSPLVFPWWAQRCFCKIIFPCQRKCDRANSMADGSMRTLSVLPRTLFPSADHCGQTIRYFLYWAWLQNGIVTTLSCLTRPFMSACWLACVL